MRFLEYLYFKYYNLGVKLGSKKNASTSAILLLSFVFYLYLFDVVITLGCLFELNWDNRWIVGFLIASFIILMAVFDFTLKKSQIVSEHKEEWAGKKNIGAILFSVIAFVWFAIALFNIVPINKGMS